MSAEALTSPRLQTDSLTELAAMSLDLYTRNIPLTQKARFWGNYVSALKGDERYEKYIILFKCYCVRSIIPINPYQGNADLCAAPEARVRTFYPSITETIPANHADLRNTAVNESFTIFGEGLLLVEH